MYILDVIFAGDPALTVDKKLDLRYAKMTTPFLNKTAVYQQSLVIQSGHAGKLFQYVHFYFFRGWVGEFFAISIASGFIAFAFY